MEILHETLNSTSEYVIDTFFFHVGAHPQELSNIAISILSQREWNIAWKFFVLACWKISTRSYLNKSNLAIFICPISENSFFIAWKTIIELLRNPLTTSRKFRTMNRRIKKISKGLYFTTTLCTVLVFMTLYVSLRLRQTTQRLPFKIAGRDLVNLNELFENLFIRKIKGR